MSEKPGMERKEMLGCESTIQVYENGAVRLEQPGGNDGVWLDQSAQRKLFRMLRRKFDAEE